MSGEWENDVWSSLGTQAGLWDSSIYDFVPFNDAIDINPSVKLSRGELYAFVDMAQIDPNRSLVQSIARREFRGGGSRFKDGDTLFARITPCLENGKIARYVSMVPDQIAHGSTEFIVMRGREGISDNNYVFYLVRSASFRSYAISRMNGSSGRQRVATDAFSGLEIPLPPLPEQRRIAKILGDLDDKIELNRKMNETLEQMARALFKSWFVDFDPVRAKMEGRTPSGMDAATAALFPDRLVDSELGPIPEGWEVGVLDELTRIVIGGDWGATEPTDIQNVACFCVRGADIPSLQEGGMGKMPTRYLRPSSIAQRQLFDGDLVIEISGGSPTQSTGRPVLVSDALLQVLQRPIVASNFCRIVKLKKTEYSKYVYYWLRSLYDAGALFQYENGTTGIKNFAFTLFSASHHLLIPNSSIARSFNTAVSSLLKAIQHNANQSHTLSTLRDTLLPKLVGGEVATGTPESTQYL